MWHSRVSEKAAGLVRPEHSPVACHMDGSWNRGVLDLDPSPLGGNFLQPPCGHGGLSKSFSTQEHIPEGQETYTFRPHSELPGRGTAHRKVMVEVVKKVEVEFQY